MSDEHIQIPFDTAASKYSGRGLPYEGTLPFMETQEFLYTLHLTGTVGCAVVDAFRFGILADVRDYIAERVMISLGLAFNDGGFGPPENLPAHAPELLERVRAKDGEYLRAQFGVEAQTLELASVTISERDAQAVAELHTQYERMEEMKRRICSGGPEDFEARRAPSMGEAMRAAQAAKPTQIAPAVGPLQRTRFWICPCGSRNETRFCPVCGAKRAWTCACGQENEGTFCSACGAKRAGVSAV